MFAFRLSLFFIEMNTRLQVEHSVTELITGIDLVEWQIKIANKEPLPLRQDEIIQNGHAFEARLYAEDPNNDFLPEIGKLIAFEPGHNDDTRWDSGVNEGSEIGTKFDPMLAKIISYAPTRNDAALKLARALESAHIGGIKTNRDFLITCLRSKEFLDGDTTSDFIDRVNPDRKMRLSSKEIEHVISISALWIQEKNRLKANIAPFMSSGWTNGRLPKQNVTFIFDNEE